MKVGLGFFLMCTQFGKQINTKSFRSNTIIQLLFLRITVLCPAGWCSYTTYSSIRQFSAHSTAPHYQYTKYQRSVQCINYVGDEPVAIEIHQNKLIGPWWLCRECTLTSLQLHIFIIVNKTFCLRLWCFACYNQWWDHPYYVPNWIEKICGSTIRPVSGSFRQSLIECIKCASPVNIYRKL